MEGKLKILETKQNLKKLQTFNPYFMHLGTLIAISLRGNVHVWLRCSKMQSPEIDTVLHWRPPVVHIFHTDPFLVKSASIKRFIQGINTKP